VSDLGGLAVKGIIFTEYIEMLEKAHSPEFVDELLDSLALASGGSYTTVGTYSLGEFDALVRATAERTGETSSTILRNYGRWMFERLAALYPQFVVGHDDAYSFLSRLGWLHYSEVVKLYPDSQVPEFDVSTPYGDSMVVVYRSPRGLGDLAHGLLDGVAAHFRETLLIERTDLEPDGTAVRFTLTRTEAV
jgi:hypothetical protein